MLEVDKIDVFYGKLHVLKELSLKVNKGEIVALIGSNGAGKSTLLKTICGLLEPQKGSIKFNGEEITSLPPHKRAKLGIGVLLEGGQLFENMTVYENMIMGAYLIPKETAKDTLEWCYRLLPILRERRNQLAGTLSGGERQMVSIARTLMLKPTLLLADEISFGIMPKLIFQLYKILERIRDEGITILMAEQHVRKALELSDRAYLVEQGKIVLEGSPKEMLKSDYVSKVYLGL
jgi:branched-chain amino acid transport system ATP-binding protein